MRGRFLWNSRRLLLLTSILLIVGIIIVDYQLDKRGQFSLFCFHPIFHLSVSHPIERPDVLRDLNEALEAMDYLHDSQNGIPLIKVLLVITCFRCLEQKTNDFCWSLYFFASSCFCYRETNIFNRSRIHPSSLRRGIYSERILLEMLDRETEEDYSLIFESFMGNEWRLPSLLCVSRYSRELALPEEPRCSGETFMLALRMPLNH